MSVTVFVSDGCVHCERLLADLSRRGVRYVTVNLSREPGRLRELERLTRERRVPVVVDHERCSVGFAGASTALEELGLS